MERGATAFGHRQAVRRVEFDDSPFPSQVRPSCVLDRSAVVAASSATLPCRPCYSGLSPGQWQELEIHPQGVRDLRRVFSFLPEGQP